MTTEPDRLSEIIIAKKIATQILNSNPHFKQSTVIPGVSEQSECHPVGLPEAFEALSIRVCTNSMLDPWASVYF